MSAVFDGAPAAAAAVDAVPSLPNTGYHLAHVSSQGNDSGSPRARLTSSTETLCEDEEASFSVTFARKSDKRSPNPTLTG